MFRELKRRKQKLDDGECIELLTTEKRGTLAVNGDMGYPYAMPMNHYYNPEDGCIYFHCGRVGHRIDALRRSDKVSFCVYDKGIAYGDSWALDVRCVIVFGRIEIVDDLPTVAHISEKLSLKFTSDTEYIRGEIEKFGAATILLRLTPEHISGKLVNES